MPSFAIEPRRSVGANLVFALASFAMEPGGTQSSPLSCVPSRDWASLFRGWLALLHLSAGVDIGGRRQILSQARTLCFRKRNYVVHRSCPAAIVPERSMKSSGRTTSAQTLKKAIESGPNSRTPISSAAPAGVGKNLDGPYTGQSA